MFADDITLTLRDRESLDGVFVLIDRFGRASNAAINREKSEFIPIGSFAEEEKQVNERSEVSTLVGTVHFRPTDQARLLGSIIGCNIGSYIEWNVLQLKIKLAPATLESMLLVSPGTSIRGSDDRNGSTPISLEYDGHLTRCHHSIPENPLQFHMEWET